MNEDEIRARVNILEKRRMEYLEVGNTKRANKIEEEIHKWENLLEKITTNYEEKIKKLEDFIKSKDLWDSYLNWR